MGAACVKAERVAVDVAALVVAIERLEQQIIKLQATKQVISDTEKVVIDVVSPAATMAS